MPGLIIVLAIMAVLGPSLNNVIIAIVIGMTAPVVRTVRSQVLSVKEMEYVVAARAIGARSARVVLRHIMPNCLAIYLILATYYLGFAIILEASLSFLGVGVPPDVPSWGGMLTAAAQGHITKAPWAGIFPGPRHLHRRAGVQPAGRRAARRARAQAPGRTLRGAAPALTRRWPRDRTTTTSSSAPARRAACLAYRLTADPSVRVLVLEAGGRDMHPLIHVPIGLGKIWEHRMF